MSDILDNLFNQLAPPKEEIAEKPSKSLLERLWDSFDRPPSPPPQKPPVEAVKAPSGHSIDTIFPALLQAESKGVHLDEKGQLIKSKVGAEGISQLMPSTAKKPGYGIEPVKDKSEKEYLRVGKEYLQKMYDKFGDWEKALAAYNAGVGNVMKAEGKAERFGGDWKEHLNDAQKKETLPYIEKVLQKGKKIGGNDAPAKPSITLGEVALGFPKALFDTIIPSAQADTGEIPYQNTAIDNAIEFGIESHIQSLKTNKKPIPTNQKVFYETVVQGKRDTLTEKDFQPEEISYLKTTLDTQMKQAISQLLPLRDEISKRIEGLPTKKDWTKGYPERLKELHKSFKSYEKTGKVDQNLFNLITGTSNNYWDGLMMHEAQMPRLSSKFGIYDYTTYADNPSDDNLASRDIIKQRDVDETSVKGIIHTTLGRFAAEFDPKTQEFTIKDTYDFNAGGVLGGNTAPSDTQAADAGGGSFTYRVLRGYAGRKMQAGKVKGRPVEIRIK